MPREITIGRSPHSRFIVPPEKDNVSHNHAKIIVNDDGTMTLCDLDSGHGTYVADKDGFFQRVFSKTITPTTTIRLGEESHDSFSFMANRALTDSKDYAFEFRHLQAQLEEQIRLEEELEAKNALNMTIVKFSSMGALGLCFLAQYIIPDLKDDPSQNLMLNRIVMAATPVIVGTFFGVKTKHTKSLKQRRARVLKCPKCGTPISEFDIQQGHCSRCKAK